MNERAEKLAQITGKPKRDDKVSKKNSYREVQRYDQSPRVGKDPIKEEQTNVPLYDKGGKEALK